MSTNKGWLYFAVGLNPYSRMVVGWAMISWMTLQFVTDAPIMAIRRRGRPAALLHHSNQGSQYASEHLQRLPNVHGMPCSMSRLGDIGYNSAMASLLASLKVERLNRHLYATRREVTADVFDYAERFYNPRRQHSMLGCLSTVEYETAMGSTWDGVEESWTSPACIESS